MPISHSLDQRKAKARPLRSTRHIKAHHRLDDFLKLSGVYTCAIVSDTY
jgi:hypothetical protein